jgi:hypothetical protein
MKNLFKLSVLALAVLVISACGKKDAPEGVAEKFINHLNKKEWDDAKKLGTEQTGQMIDMMKSFADMGGQQAAEKKDIKIEGLKCDTKDDKSTCTYTQEGKQEKLELVKKDGKWLVDMKKDTGAGAGDQTTPPADTTAKQ